MNASMVDRCGLELTRSRNNIWLRVNMINEVLNTNTCRDELL
jgi:hypothetical protein